MLYLATIFVLSLATGEVVGGIQYSDAQTRADCEARIAIVARQVARILRDEPVRIESKCILAGEDA